MTRAVFIFANFAALQIGWLLAVVGAAYGIGWAGPAWAVAIVLVYVATAVSRRSELVLVCAAILLGALLDSIMLRLGFIEYAAPGLVPSLAPLWIIGLWALLATALTRSLGWLVGRPWLAAAIGAVVAPLSYWAGVALGAAGFSAGPGAGLAACSVAWGLALPVLAVTAGRLAAPREHVATDSQTRPVAGCQSRGEVP